MLTARVRPLDCNGTMIARGNLRGTLRNISARRLFYELKMGRFASVLVTAPLEIRRAEASDGSPQNRVGKETVGHGYRFCEKSWDGAPIGRHGWIGTMLTQGLLCRLDSCHAGASRFNVARAGQTEIVNVDLAWQSVSPIAQRDATAWSGEHLFVKVVTSGEMSIEQRGQTTMFGPGDMAMVDPMHMFNESFRESTRMSVLRIPKAALRERGLRHRFPVLFRPDPESPDVGAVREFVLNLASQAGRASDALLARLGDQCLS
jgi:AraC-like protein